MFRALIDWMDRDWASRKYSPVFAFGQRLVWCIPVFLSLAAIGGLDALGFARDSTATLVAAALGAIGMIAIMLVSLYRWGIGYGRSEFQERATAEHRAQVEARRALFQRWFRPNDRSPPT